MKEIRPFNLEAAKAGAPLIRADGVVGRLLAHVPDAQESQRLVILWDVYSGFAPGIVAEYREDGRRANDDRACVAGIGPFCRREGRPVFYGDMMSYRRGEPQVVRSYREQHGLRYLNDSIISSWSWPQASSEQPPAEEQGSIWILITPDTLCGSVTTAQVFPSAEALRAAVDSTWPFHLAVEIARKDLNP